MQKGRLSIEVLLATVIIREDMDGMLFQGVGNGVGSLEVKCDSIRAWPAHCKFHGTKSETLNLLPVALTSYVLDLQAFWAKPKRLIVAPALLVLRLGLIFGFRPRHTG